MKAIDEIKRLIDKIADGTLPPDEPLFVLRAQDAIASQTVRYWCSTALSTAAPDNKINEAIDLAKKMDDWPVRQVPGRPDTRQTRTEKDEVSK